MRAMKTDNPKQEAIAENESKITVAGVTFGARDVKSAVLTIDGRDIQIGEKTPDEKKIGFK